MAGDKPFKPSKKKLERARKDGKVLKSQVVTQAFGLGSTAISALYLIQASLVRNKILLEYLLLEGFKHPLESLWLAWGELIKIGLGSLACGCCISTIVEISQVGFHFESGILTPKASCFSLGAGAKKIFEGLKTSWLKLLNVIILGFSLFCFFCLFAPASQRMFFHPMEQFPVGLKFWCLAAMSYLAAVFLGLGALEYFVRRKSFFRELSMSHEEVRREHKELEGDPYHKSARRAMHEAVMQQDIVARVRKARVIIVEK